ncbi:hypothetical protein [Cryobacterium cryoconiti]|uniref:Uncharacterized protein n=1 Tax=Cryobacterium cryoconiti TaxID=1259239 RepID=A0A4Y8JTC7_9MICO|nr:hypothetical protein [Cryobacterium cryoconiti]TFD29600.1 hypothetical protein E3T49_09240 [Cryobacterium cryoconiti]
MGIPGDTFLSDYAVEARLDGLRERRMLLRQLRDDVDLAAGRLTAADLTGSWRSPAQQGYDAQRGDLAGDLRRAAVLIDDALTAVVTSIDEIRAARDAAAAPAPAASPAAIPVARGGR